MCLIVLQIMLINDTVQKPQIILVAIYCLEQVSQIKSLFGFRPFLYLFQQVLPEIFGCFGHGANILCICGIAVVLFHDGFDSVEWEQVGFGGRFVFLPEVGINCQHHCFVFFVFLFLLLEFLLIYLFLATIQLLPKLPNCTHAQLLTRMFLPPLLHKYTVGRNGTGDFGYIGNFFNFLIVQVGVDFGWILVIGLKIF